jgi:predicted transcriptional regulator
MTFRSDSPVPHVLTIDNRRTEALADLTSLVLECEHLYPGIDLWFNRKVLPGLSSGSRVAYVAYDGHRLIGGAVLRRGGNAKLCSLRIRNEYAGRGFGTGLFHLAALEASRLSSTLHFTAPEELALSEKIFFEAMGFRSLGGVEKHYRTGQGEHAFVAEIPSVLRRTNELVRPTLLGADVGATAMGHHWMIMSIHPKYASLILDGKKTIEIRRQFSAGNVGMRMLIYSTHPKMALVGTAKITGASKVSGSNAETTICDEACVTAEEFKEYASSRGEVWAIRLAEVTRFPQPLQLKHLSEILQAKLRPPQSFEIIRRGSSWGRVADHLAMSGKLDEGALSLAP